MSALVPTSLARLLGLDGRVAIVTGAAKGLGFVVAKMLAEQGAQVALLDLDMQACDSAATSLRALGLTAAAFDCDVADEAAVRAGVANARAKFGAVSILVNCAGVVSAPGKPFTRVPAHDFERTMSVNLNGAFHLAKACHDDLIASTHGRVINLSSVTGIISAPFMPAYTVSKAAVISLTKVLARDFAEHGVTANVICPGFIWTPLWEQLGHTLAALDGGAQGATAQQVFEGRVEQLVPMKRPQTAQDVAALVAFLASDAAANLTGQVIAVDGGVSI